MTSQKYIQSLIDDIDAILPKAEARLPWSKPGDVAAQRRVLERVRSYLASEQQNIGTSIEHPLVPAAPEQQEVLQQIVQAVTQEMDVMRVNLMQPMQAEIEALHQQRNSLVQEIRQLERNKQQLDSIRYRQNNEQELISEISEGLIERCSEKLTQQLGQILANWEVSLANLDLTEEVAPASFKQASVESVIHSQDRLDQLRQLQEQSDRLLTNLDANQRAIFEALQRNIQGYQESLSQGLDKMHRLGVQGETLFTALVNRLAQQLGREASTLLQSSLQLSDSADQPNEAPTSPPTPETLLPTNALKGAQSNTSQASGLTLLPNPIPETPTPLQPLQSPEQLDTQPVSALEAAEVQQKTPDATAMPDAPHSDELPPLTDMRSPTLNTQSQPTAEDKLQENLNAPDWEIIEGLDFGSLEFESDDSGVETFIQLDLDSQASLPLVDETMTPGSSDTQELDFLSKILNEQFPTVTPLTEYTRIDNVERLDHPNQSAELDVSSELHRQEIDELYESLFGTNAISAQALPDELEPGTVTESDTPEQKALTDLPMLRDDPSNTDSGHPLSAQVEEILFESFVDPAAESPESQALDALEEQSPESWEGLFFDDSVAEPPIETALVEQEQEFSLLDNSLSESENASAQEGIKTISALTDLFEEMGLSEAVPIVEADSPPVKIEERSPNPSSETNSQTNLIEDTYIPASPDENLLLTNELEPELNREIVLDENTLQKLSEDLFSFEESESQQFQRQEEHRPPSNDTQSLPVVPDDAELANLENLRFPVWEELLAEDWEEFLLNDWYEQASMSQGLEIESTIDLPVEIDINPEAGTTGSTQEEILDNSTPTAPEDEAFLEMLWEEQIDSTIEEMITSPELEFESDFFLQETPDLQPDSTNNLDEEASTEDVQKQSLDDAQETTLPTQISDNEVDFISQNGQEFKQEDEISSEGETLSEHQHSNNLKQEGQTLDQSNLDRDLPQRDRMNPERPENSKKKNNSDANP
ncbi:MAG TPA: hypothetical protein DCE56_14975 [Cyanobacteria bacterium UBA8553]|nr:hypothetical protein [Cyanobacteria bacterium UBA8553]